ncbi:hypothetical protein FOZ63_032795 [Perkinsus olseni]|uniref:Uncharacterized protein n=1 Tax=Perkinsus olseni TaxID=32597 RepID=A0A7J6RJY4_PEROL|nr:hypothetical protein FOZ63_032795 [Perkinsus olseni]
MAINAYNRCPHASLEGSSPAECLVGRNIRTEFCMPVKVPPPEPSSDLVVFQKGQLVWLLKPKAERRSGERFYPYQYVIIECSPYAYKLVRSDGHSNQVTATVDRLVLCRHQPLHEPVIPVDSHSSSSTTNADNPMSSLFVDPLIYDDTSSVDDVQHEHLPQMDSPQEDDLDADDAVLPSRSRHPPVRFEPGGDPRQMSFDIEDNRIA